MSKEESSVDVSWCRWEVGTEVGYMWPGGGYSAAGFSTIESIDPMGRAVLANGRLFSPSGHSRARGARTDRAGQLGQILVNPRWLQAQIDLWSRDQELRRACMQLASAVARLVSHPGYLDISVSQQDHLVTGIHMVHAELIQYLSP